MRNNSNATTVNVQELPNWRDIVQEQGHRGTQQLDAVQSNNGDRHGAWEKFTRAPFRHDSLARELKRHHITGATPA